MIHAFICSRLDYYNSLLPETASTSSISLTCRCLSLARIYPKSLAVRLSLHICLKSRPGFLSPRTSNRLNRRSSFWLPTSSMTVPRGICLTVCKSRYLQHHHVPCALLGILSFLFCHDPAPGFCNFGVRFSQSLKFHSDIRPCL